MQKQRGSRKKEKAIIIATIHKNKPPIGGLFLLSTLINFAFILRIRTTAPIVQRSVIPSATKILIVLFGKVPRKSLQMRGIV